MTLVANFLFLGWGNNAGQVEHTLAQINTGVSSQVFENLCIHCRVEGHPRTEHMLRYKVNKSVGRNHR